MIRRALIAAVIASTLALPTFTTAEAGGLRDKTKAVTLQTVDGPIEQTAEGVQTCLVTSTPADDVRRQVLIPLWNTYAFFVNYARLDAFDPAGPAVPCADRPEIDRWILSNLQALVQTARTEMESFNAPGFLREAARFIDDLSNWYIRRNRRRFWRSRGGDDRDKQAAYQTLYTVLTTLTKLLAPVIPFLTERMYQNLRLPGAGGAASRTPDPDSVHLCPFPEVDPSLLDAQLSERMALAQKVVNLGHALREQSGQRVRQPLPELRFACSDPAQRAPLESLGDVIREELNVKKITGCEHLDDLVHYVYKPNLKTLGPKYGKGLAAIGRALPAADPASLAPLRRGETVTLLIEGADYLLAPEDVLVSTEQAADWIAADSLGVQIALSTVLTPELIREGMARDFVRHVQQARKEADLEIENRIGVAFATASADVRSAIEEWSAYIRQETLADELKPAQGLGAGARAVLVGDQQIELKISRVEEV